MAKITFEQIDRPRVSENTSNRSSIGFFGLKDDGDEAIVRIMHDSTDSFDMLTVHPIEIDGRYRKVNCIRDAKDSLDKCPMCNSGMKTQSRLFIHLIQYSKDENGNMVAEPKTWERPASYAVTLKNLIDEYGPLSESIFKVRRNGARGDMKTTYSVLYGNPNIYKNELYPKVEGAFDNFSVVGTVVMDKTSEEMAEYLITGSFPSKTNAVDDNTSTSKTTAPNETFAYPAPMYKNETFATANDNIPPWEARTTTTPNVQRPVRYF